VDNPIKRYSWKEGILGSPKGELIPTGTFTTFRPCVRPPQGKAIEVGLISENKLIRTKMGINECSEVLPVLLISLQSRTSDLEKKVKLFRAM
jgi:hypothetical protein